MAENTDRPTGANPYSIYVQRDTDSTQVNWGQIAKDLTSGMEAIRDSREAQKDAINEATRKAMDDLNKIAGTDNQSLGKLLINGSDFSKKTLMENMELLRNGGLDPKDYQLIMQSQLDGYKNLSEYVKGADAKYQEAMARLEAGEDGASIASDLEIAWNEGTFGFGDLKDKRLITNPRNGELVLVTMVDDGTGNLVMPDPDKRPDLYQNTAYLNVRSDFKLDRRDTNKLANGVVENLASVITSSVGQYSAISGGGVVTSVKDFRQLFDDKRMKDYLSLENDDGSAMTYDQFMDDQINMITGDVSDLSSMNAAQVLSGAGYKFVQSAEEAREKGITKYVLYNNVNGTPQVELTDAQMKEARNIAKRAIESRIDLEIKKSQPDTGEQVNPVKEKIDRDEKLKEDNRFGYIKQINTMLTGNTSAAQNEANNLIDQYNATLSDEDIKTKGLRGIVVTDNTIRIIRNDGSEYEQQRFDIDDQDQRTNTAISKDVANIFNQIVPGLGTDVVSEEQINEIIEKKNYTFGERRAAEDILNFRRGEKELSFGKLVNTQASEALGGKDPLSYLIDDFGDSTAYDDMTDEIGPSIRNVLQAMLPADLIKLNNDMGYDDPFTSFKIVDTATKDTVEFSFGGQKFKIDFGTDRSPQYVLNKIEDTIKKGIENMNKKRTKSTFNTQLNFEEWKADANANPGGSVKYSDYREWLRTN